LCRYNVYQQDNTYDKYILTYQFGTCEALTGQSHYNNPMHYNCNKAIYCGRFPGKKYTHGWAV